MKKKLALVGQHARAFVSTLTCRSAHLGATWSPRPLHTTSLPVLARAAWESLSCFRVEHRCPMAHGLQESASEQVGRVQRLKQMRLRIQLLLHTELCHFQLL